MSHNALPLNTDARIVKSREAMLAAAERLLATGGIEAVTHVAVALQAGVGRATVYRHWPRPMDLLRDTFQHTTLPVFEFGNGPVRAETLDQLNRRLPWFNQRAAGSLIGTVIARAEFEPEVRQMRAALFEKTGSTLVEQLERGRRRGELQPGADPRTLSALIMGAVFFTRHMLGTVLTETDIESIVDGALSGWLVTA